MYFLKISKSICNDFSFTCTRLKFKKGFRIPRNNWKSYDVKLDNSISRAKSNCLNICKFNKFYYFFTLTINSCYNREDLSSFVKRFNNVVKYLNKKSCSNDFYYLFIPEFHADNKSYHLHGFLSEAFSNYYYINRNGFPALSCFKKLGFDSISVIRDYMACVSYCLKYMSKELLSFDKGLHLYYCSHGLKRDNVVNSFTFSQIPPIHFDFKSLYCFKSTVNENKYYNFIKRLDSYNNYHYYDYS